MSVTIRKNKLKFEIFGHGHDYTLNNSGSGDAVTIFSHPFVPKGSMIYAGQFYFEVPVYDEDDPTIEPVMTDVVRFDNAHCSFSPTLGSTFNDEGSVTVRAYYHREYVYDEETIVVERTYEQTIEVVDHGEILESHDKITCYEDGYGYVHVSDYFDSDPQHVPEDEYDFESYTYVELDGGGSYVTKLSSLPWRTTDIYSGDSGMAGITDISELAYADASNITDMRYAFMNCSASDFTPLANWKVSKCTDFTCAFEDCSMTSMGWISGWKLQGDLDSIFSWCNGIKSLDGMEDMDMSGVTSMRSMFFNCTALKDISAVKKWNVSNVTDMGAMFRGCSLRDMTDFQVFADWDVSKVTSMASMFNYANLNAKSLKGLENWDVSKVTNMSGMFRSGNPTSLNPKNMSQLVDISALENWDVSKVTDFSYMFACKIWLTDLSPIEGWDVSSGKYFNNMFEHFASLHTPPDFSDWDFSSATNMYMMFGSPSGMYDVNYPPAVGKMYQIFHNSFNEGWYIRYDRVIVYSIKDMYTTAYTHDASSASDWTVSLSGTNAFSGWDNRPAWG